MSDADLMSLEDFENSGSEYVPTPSGSSISSPSSEDALPGSSGLVATESQIGIKENELDIELKICTRKRVTKKSNCKKHVSKIQRNSGKSYKTVKGVMKPEPLYPGGRLIDAAKFKDLQELKEFIPPIKHAFYNNLKTNSRAEEEDIQEGNE